MKASVLQELVSKLNPNEEVAFEIVRERDIQDTAKEMNVTITPNQAIQIVQAISNRGDDPDDMMEYYVQACLDGELEEAEA